LLILDFIAIKALKVVVIKALLAYFLAVVWHLSKLGVGPLIATRAEVFAVGSDFEDSLYLSVVKTSKGIVVSIGVHFVRCCSLLFVVVRLFVY